MLPAMIGVGPPGVVALLCALLVVKATHLSFVWPHFRSVEQLLAARADPRIVAAIDQGGPVCLVLERMNQPFLYASLWYPGKHYSIQAGPWPPQNVTELEQTCAGRRVINAAR